MTTFEVLNSHPISSLKKHISQSNIKGYSKLKKKELIELMIKHKDKFGHIVKKEKIAKANKANKATKAKTTTKAKQIMKEQEIIIKKKPTITNKFYYKTK